MKVCEKVQDDHFYERDLFMHAITCYAVTVGGDARKRCPHRPHRLNCQTKTTYAKYNGMLRYVP